MERNRKIIKEKEREKNEGKLQKKMKKLDAEFSYYLNRA
jgi:hypothetical protein